MYTPLVLVWTVSSKSFYFSVLEETLFIFPVSSLVTFFNMLGSWVTKGYKFYPCSTCADSPKSPFFLTWKRQKSKFHCCSTPALCLYNLKTAAGGLPFWPTKTAMIQHANRNNFSRQQQQFSLIVKPQLETIFCWLCMLAPKVANRAPIFENLFLKFLIFLAGRHKFPCPITL